MMMSLCRHNLFLVALNIMVLMRRMHLALNRDLLNPPLKRPIPHFIKVTTTVHRVQLGEILLELVVPSIDDGRDVGGTGKRLAQGLDAVVQVPELRGFVVPCGGGVVFGPERLAEHVLQVTLVIGWKRFFEYGERY